MLADVVNKVFLSGERFGAEAASVWRLTRVLADVVQKVLLSRECLRAEITAVRRLTRVPHYVVREVFLSRKRLTCIRSDNKTKNTNAILIFPLYCNTNQDYTAINQRVDSIRLNRNNPSFSRIRISSMEI